MGDLTTSGDFNALKPRLYYFSPNCVFDNKASAVKKFHELRNQELARLQDTKDTIVNMIDKEIKELMSIEVEKR